MSLNRYHRKSALLLSLTIPLLALSGCGGSSSGSSVVTNVSQPDTGSNTSVTDTTWVKDSFKPVSTYVARCAKPRTGNNPITGEAYPDKAGSELLEKFWQRSFNNDTYLWYKEVLDQDPNNFNLVDYFDQLKTKAVTDSGAEKDQFHWISPTSDVEERTQLGVSYGYGISYHRGSNTPPRSWQVTNVTPGTKAADTISRGSKLISIDGVDFVNSSSDSDLATINGALFSTNEGEEHTFKFINTDNAEYEVTLATASIQGVPLQLAKTLDTPQGKVGYLLLTSFNNAAVEKDLVEEFTKFEQENITDLVVDLRYNGGGFLALSSQLAYMVAGKEATRDKTYDRLIYNDKLASQNQNIGFFDTTIDLRRLIGGETIIPENQPLPALNLSRVYVLTTGSSCSASESFMNSLIGIDVEVIQIGETTCGKPYGFVSEDNCGSTYFTIQFRGENHAGFGDYADGFTPATLPNALDQVQGCPIQEDYLHELGDPDELLLSSALYYQANNTCPEIKASVGLQTKSRSGVGALNKNVIQKYDGPKLNVRTPRQDAIIDDIYYDQFNNLKTGTNNGK